MSTEPATSPAAEADFLDRVRKRDEAAVRQFHDRHAPAVHVHLRRRFGDDPEHEDIVQAVFMYAVDNIDRYRGEASVETWLCRVAVKVASSNWRDRGRRGELRSALEAVQGTNTARLHESPLDRRHDAHNLLGHLPENLRRLLVLHHAHGWSIRELARHMNRTKSTVERMLSTARERLRTLALGEGVARA